MSYTSYYPVSPAIRVAYLLDMPRQPCESCGLVLVVSVLRIDSLHAMSAQVTWGAWFDFVTGILLFRALLGFGSTWDGPDLELIMGDPNRKLDANPSTQMQNVVSWNIPNSRHFGDCSQLNPDQIVVTF